MVQRTIHRAKMYKVPLNTLQGTLYLCTTLDINPDAGKQPEPGRTVGRVDEENP